MIVVQTSNKLQTEATLIVQSTSL